MLCSVMFLCASEGKWTLTAKFDHRQQNTFTSEFEVKKYGTSGPRGTTRRCFTSSVMSNERNASCFWRVVLQSFRPSTSP